jgi:hypothetical protein
LHVAWMAVFVGLALWAGWLFRFEGDRDLYYLDRWTGELVNPGGWGFESRTSLRAIKNKPPIEPSAKRLSADEFLDQAFDAAAKSPPSGAAPAPSQPPATGSFDDLIPKRGDGK